MGMPARKLKRGPVPVPVRFGEDERTLLRTIEARAKAEDRSMSGQIKHLARIGMIAKDNPDLPLAMIEGIIEAREEFKAGLGKPYEWGVVGKDA
jgi:ParD-like antitoxin of type II bacterial toxin-antitoxin system